MNEDPTRLMDYGDEPPRRRRPPQHKPKGNLRLVVAVMGAVIFGLLIALLVSCGGGETKTVTETKVVTHEVTSSQEKGNGEGEEGEEEEGAEGEEGEEETGGIEEGVEGEETFEGVPEEEGGEIELAPEEEVFEEEGGGVEAE